MKINIEKNIYKKIPAAECKKIVLAALGPLGKKEGEVGVIFLSGPDMRKLNKKFLGHDYETDVLSFNYARDGKFYGEIFVCPKVAAQNAPLYNQDVLTEIMMYAAHGALHLTGMDDATKKQRAAMDRAALKILNARRRPRRKSPARKPAQAK